LVARQKIIDELRRIIEEDDATKVDVSNVGEQTRIDKIGFDSLSILEFMYEIEHRFSIDMEVSDLVEMEVVADLVDHLERKAAT
jgi:acyl carrier protein